MRPALREMVPVRGTHAASCYFEMKTLLDFFRRIEPETKPVESRKSVTKITSNGAMLTLECPGFEEEESAPVAKPSQKAPEPLAAPIAPAQVQPIPVPPPPAPQSKPLEFELGDFLSRIPEQLLKPGPHDPKIPVFFDPALIGDCIAYGETTIPLSDLYRSVPEIFRGEIRQSDNLRIRFPWKKLMGVQGERSEGRALTEEAAEVIAKKFREYREAIATQATRAAAAEETPQTTPPEAPATAPAAAPDPAGQAPSWFSRKSAPPGALMTVPMTSTPVPPGSLTTTPVTKANAPASKTAAPAAEPRKVEELPGSDELLRLRDEVAREIISFRDEQKNQLTALADSRRSLSEMWEQALIDLDRARKELDFKNRELELRSAGERDTTRRQMEEQARQMPELERLIQSSELKLSSMTQERDGLLQLKAHLSSQFEQLCLARRDYEGLVGEIEGKSKACADAQHAAAVAEQKMNSMAQERDALARENEQLKSEIAPLRNARDEAESAARNRAELEQKVTALESAVAAAENGQREAAEAAREALATARREAEGLLQRRGAEASRVEKDLQAEVDLLKEAGAIAATEREQLLERINQLEQAAGAAKGRAETESRTAASLQDEVEKHRQQMSALRKDRDALSRERKLIASHLARRSSAPATVRKAAGAPGGVFAGSKSRINALLPKSTRTPKQDIARNGPLPAPASVPSASAAPSAPATTAPAVESAADPAAKRGLFARMFGK